LAKADCQTDQIASVPRGADSAEDSIRAINHEPKVLQRSNRRLKNARLITCFEAARGNCPLRRLRV
jgi:hypothetical protein